MTGSKYALFLGCTIPARSPNYEVATRKVCETLGIDIIDIEDFTCCGYPVRPVDLDTFLAMAAFNLTLAEEKGTDILCLCSACAATLTKAQKEISNDKEIRDKVNDYLRPLGKEFGSGVKVKHFARFLYEDIGPNKIKEKVIHILSDFKVAPHYGCHYLKPSEIYDGFDDPTNPQSLHRLIEATGAKVVDYMNPKQCCGGGILGIAENTSMKMAKMKLDAVKDAGADAIVLICPFCNILFDEYQRTISKMGVEYNIPVLFYPQLLGLALGLDPIDLGMKKNAIKPTAFMKEGGK